MKKTRKQTQPAPAHDRALALVTRPALRDEYGITWSMMHLTRQEKLGRFPQRVRLGANSVAWVRVEIEEWLKARMHARRPINHEARAT
jgi:predicted DNA-binding transcriptional regulator AlpA